MSTRRLPGRDLDDARSIEKGVHRGVRHGRRAVFEAWTAHAGSDFGEYATSHTIVRPSSLRARQSTSSWRGAAVRVDVSRELFRNPAGYSAKSRTTSGYLLPRFARLCLLEDPQGERCLLVALDALAGSRWLAERMGADLAEPLGVDVSRVFLTATHTHCAAGNVFGDLFYDAMADSLMRGFDGPGAEWLASRLTRAAVQLGERLTEVEVCYGTQLLPPGLLWQRALAPFLAQVGSPDELSDAEVLAEARQVARSAGVPDDWVWTGSADPIRIACRTAVDPWVRSLVVRRGGHSMFSLSTVSATGTMCAPHTELLSSDVYGAAAVFAERSLARDGRAPVAGIAAGSHGDVNVVHPDQLVPDILESRGEKDGNEDRPLEERRRVALRHVNASGALIAEAIVSSVVNASPIDADAMVARYAEVFTPGAVVSTAGLRVPAGLDGPSKERLHLPTHFEFGAATTQASEFNAPPDRSRAAWPRDKKRRRKPNWSKAHDPKRERDWVMMVRGGASILRERGYSPFLPLRILELGETRLVGVPTEPSVRIGQRIREAIGGASSQRAGGRVLVAGNVGGFTGYSDTIGAYLIQEYEGASSYWGREFGELHVQELAALAAADDWKAPDGRLPDVIGDTPTQQHPNWLCGGVVAGDGAPNAVGGSAYFTLSRNRHRTASPRGAGAKVPERNSHFRAAEPINPDRALPDGPSTVTGSWVPRRRATHRRLMRNRSFPMLADHGPFVVFWERVHPDGEPKRLRLGGVDVTSASYPVLVLWDGRRSEPDKTARWRFFAELDVPDGVELGFTVEGVEAVQPRGSGEIVWLSSERP